MSINVTVSGNPVRISRSKMVTTCDPSKKEFQKRRLMRLEQVRHQSKDIAENIRNKIKKEKTKCLSDVEKEGEIKLKNWQARKLLELQNQYQEALGEIGLAHKQAVVAEDEEEKEIEQQQNNEKTVQERGRAAADRMQIQKNEESLKKAMPIQRKKITRDVENARSNTVASMQKDKKSNGSVKKKKTKQDAFDSDSENRIPQLTGLDSDSFPNSPELQQSSQIANRRNGEVLKASKEQQTSDLGLKAPTTDKSAQTFHPDQILPPEKPIPLDTRISDRIKRRAKLNCQLNYCDYMENQSLQRLATCPCCKCCKCLIKPHIENIPQTIPEAEEKKINKDATLKSDSLLRIPTTKEDSNQRFGAKTGGYSKSDVNADDLRISTTKGDSNQRFGVKSGEKSKSDVNAVKDLHDKSRISTTVGDSNQRFGVKSGEKSKSNVNTVKDLSEAEAVAVETNKSLEKTKSKTEIPSKPKVTLRPRPGPGMTDSRTKPVQYYDHPHRYSKMYVPKVTHVEKIDDDNLVISPNPLTEEELKEKMRQRDIEAQIRGEVALEKEKLQKEYQELLRKLPALQKQERIFEIGKDKEKYHMSKDRLEELEKNRQNRLDNAYEELFVRQKPTRVTLPKKENDWEDPRCLNLSNWDVDFDSNHKNRTEQLSDMLSDLKTHKTQLLKEIESTLSKETSGRSRKTHDDVKSKSTDYTRKRSRDERLSPTSSNPEDESKTKSSKKGTLVSTTATATSSLPSPRKKPKLKSSKRKVLVLQNTSTQTTPKPGQSAATSPHRKSPVPKVLEPCVCKKDTQLDDLCEIVIKIKEDEKPEVVVNPPFMGKSVRVIKADEESRDKGKKAESSKNGSSWREQLSHTGGTSQSTASTSYMDPPKTFRKKTVDDDVSRSVDSSVSKEKRMDPRLLTYIKKLLSMSRASIEDLTVSAASEVSTPSPSVVETPSNIPLSQLQTIMKYFNISPAELQKQLSRTETSEESDKHYNSNESVVRSISTSSDADKSYKSCTEIDEKASNQKLQQYADIAASCTAKISNLTAMIEKVRAEKRKILQSSTSSDDNELTTTSYMLLPDKNQKDKSDSPGGSMDEERLDRIDYSYAEKLKQLTDDEIQSEKKRVEEEKSKQSKKVQIAEPVASPSLFLDIPKLPKLEVSSLEKKTKKPPPSKGLSTIPRNVTIIPHELSTIVEADSQLSTKLESPTKPVKSTDDALKQINDDQSQSISNSSDDISEMETMETMLISIGMDWAIPTLKKTRETLALTSSSGSGSKGSGELSLREFLSKISSTSSNLSESHSQGMSMIEVDNRRTSTPIVEPKEKKDPMFMDSDLSSVREHSDLAKDSSEKFYDLNEGSLSKTA